MEKNSYIILLSDYLSVKPCNFKNVTSSQVFNHEDDMKEHNQLNKQVKLTQSHLLESELNFTLF